MKHPARRAVSRAPAGLGLALLLLFGAGCFRSGNVAGPAPAGAAARASAAEAAISKWKEGPRAIARAMIAEYGEPDRVTRRALRWDRRGPWAKIIAHRSAWPEILGKRDKDYLEQTLDYRVPDDRVAELQHFDERLEINRRGGQLSARSPNEATNILILNLAREIGAGVRDSASARALAARIEALAKAGKSSPYRERLLFPPRAK